jgi:hypothetical protein
MSGPLSNAERQARHRAKERERVLALEREVHSLREALRNGTAPQPAPLECLCPMCRIHPRPVLPEQALRNGSAPQPPPSPEQSTRDLVDRVWQRMERYKALAKLNEEYADYEWERADTWRGWCKLVVEKFYQNADETMTKLDNNAKEIFKDWDDELETALDNFRGQFGDCEDNDNEQQADEVARASEETAPEEATNE